MKETHKGTKKKHYIPYLTVDIQKHTACFVFSGVWDIGTLEEGISLLDKIKEQVLPNTVRSIRCVLTDVDKIDSAAILYIIIAVKNIIGKHGEYTVEGREEIKDLFETVASKDATPPQRVLYIPFFFSILYSLGKWLEDKFYFYRKMLTFFGYLITYIVRSILSPRMFHWGPIVSHMEQMGIRAIPIVALLSFLIGMVLAYMSAGPFQRFGATIYVIHLLDITVLRELGVLLTAIIVAGRTGASCTAEIGSMMNNEEVASMQILGLHYMEYLVIPRVLALIFMLPVVTIVADACALLGGMFATWFSLDIAPQTFWSVFTEATQLKTFYLGLIKAPVFAFIITGVGCFYGLQSTGSSDEIGKLTTDSVVQALFLVIIFDAIFAVMYSKLGL